ncbi:MAG: type II toxin-antitoxin system VapC family toxin [Hyphomicrobium sp.]
MIVDTSAVLAILFEESEAELYARALTADSCPPRTSPL